MWTSMVQRFYLWSVIVVAATGFSGTNDCMFYRIVSSQQTDIVDFNRDGMLTWSNATSNATCRIESLPSLIAPSNSSLSAAISCSNYLTSVRMPMSSLPTPALLSIYSDGWGTLLETWAVPVDVSVTIQVQESNPYSDPPQYYVYVHQDECYTELLYFTNSTTVVINPDAMITEPLSMTGVIFAQQSFFRDCYLKSNKLSITGPSGPLPDVMTDEYGRYTINGLETGIHILSFSYLLQPYSFELYNTYDTDYTDLYFWEPYQVEAPNIYLYPEIETNVQVSIGFPNYGQLTESEPDYGAGWNVSVSTNGVINSKYDYLFYEVSMPGPLQTEKGWLLDGGNLENELHLLLADLGFIDREIDDFMAYWLPLMQGPAWYAVYWKPADEVTTLDISPEPDSLLRAHFIFRALTHPIQIPAPEIPSFTRTGFSVVEWGVVGWDTVNTE